MKRTTLLLAIVVSAGAAWAQDDPAAATRQLLDRDEPFGALEQVHLLGAYDGLTWAGQVELAGTVETGDVYRVTNRVEAAVETTRHKVEVEARLRFDLTVDDYRRVEDAQQLYVQRRTEETVKREGDEWVVRRTVTEGRRGVEPKVDEARHPVEPGVLPEALAAIVPPILAGQPAGRRFAWRFIVAPGKVLPAEYVVVGPRRIGVAGETVEAILVRLRHTVLEVRSTGKERQRDVVVDYYVSPEGALQRIEWRVVRLRYLAIDEDDVGKDLALEFEGERDENGETAAEALLALFAAMESEDADEIDARVDYELFFYDAMAKNPGLAMGKDAPTDRRLRVPRAVLRQMWADMGEAHARAIRGTWFAKKEAPVGENLASRLETKLEGHRATVTRGGGIVRIWHMSRESGRWKVVAYEEP